MRTRLSLVVALVLTLVACGGAAAESTSTEAATTTEATTSSSTTTTATTTTTTTIDDRPLSPVNGLPVDDPDDLDRPILAVKIDNHPNARPHSGVEDADMVMELMVEGITRFITVFAQSDSTYLGPIRSGRPTDASMLAHLQAGFVTSGAQVWVQGLFSEKGIPFWSEPAGTHRAGSRRSPHNVYGDTTELRLLDQREGPEEPLAPLWSNGEMPRSAPPATTVDIPFRAGSAVTWEWDGDTYLRWLNGAESAFVTETGVEGQLSADVLVVLYGTPYTARGSSGSALPSTETVGTNRAQVFADGKVVEGTWSRETDADWFTLTDADGETIEVPAGRSWVSLLWDTEVATWE